MRANIFSFIHSLIHISISTTLAIRNKFLTKQNKQTNKQISMNVKAVKLDEISHLVDFCDLQHKFKLLLVKND